MKITKHIPNTITCFNLLSGSIAVILSFNQELTLAILLILIAAIFDFCDGLAARVLNAYSNIGKELDSLADLISFGLAPSLILYNILSPIHGNFSIVSLSPLLIAIGSALRLAKFNVDERQTKNFIGMPTPAAAILIGSFTYFAVENLNFLRVVSESLIITPLFSLIIALLLTSEIEMFSFKFQSVSIYKNKIQYSFFAISIIIFILTLSLGHSIALAALLISVAYVIINLIPKIKEILLNLKFKIKKD